MSKVIAILNKYLILRYAISGGFSSAIDILIFSLLIEFIGLHYIISSIISVSISFVIRFYLQKSFTFKDRNLDIHKQIIMYSILYFLSVIMTALLLYIFIDIFNIWYLFAQIMAIGIVAIMCFFVYKHVIFKNFDSDILKKS